MPQKPAKPLTPDQVLDKMAKYCAYQERCVKDIRDKLKTFDISQEDSEKILDFPGNIWYNETAEKNYGRTIPNVRAREVE